MTVIQDLQAVLIDALLTEATADQAGRALDRLARVVSGPAFVVAPDEDEAAAAWLANVLTKLSPAVLASYYAAGNVNRHDNGA